MQRQFSRKSSRPDDVLTFVDTKPLILKLFQSIGHNMNKTQENGNYNKLIQNNANIFLQNSSIISQMNDCNLFIFLVSEWTQIDFITFSIATKMVNA